MPATPTPRLKLPLPAQTDPADVPTDLSKLATALDSGGSGGVGSGVAVDGQGTLSQRPAAGVIGRYFYATDTSTLYRDTGSAWVQLGPPPLVTALPATPTDGQECYYQLNPADVPGSGLWHLRYNAASTSPYKWEFLGGRTILATTAAPDLAVTGTTYSTNAPGPGVNLPCAGEYIIAFGMYNYNVGTVAMSIYMGMLLGATYPADDSESISQNVAANAGPGRGHITQFRQREFLVAKTSINAVYRATATPGGYANCRWISAQPVRVI